MRPIFDSTKPIPGYQDAPPITAEQMSRFLYSGIGSGAAERIAKELNEAGEAWGGPEWLQTTYVEPPKPYVAPVEDRTNWGKGDVVRCLSRTLPGGDYEHYGVVGQEYTISEPLRDNGVSDVAFEGGGSGARERFTLVSKAKPTRLPIERPVRLADVEAGDILLYCGVEDHHGSWPAIGSEVVVQGISQYGNLQYRCTTKSGEVIERQNAPDYCVAQGFSFVRRPFKAGEAVMYTNQSEACPGWEGVLLIDTDEKDRPPSYGAAVINHKGARGSIEKSLLKRVL